MAKVEKKAAPRTEVECVKDGWVCGGKPVAIGEKRAVTDVQKKRLVKAGLVKA